MTIYAFPNVHDPKTGSMAHGMTLRDYFAAQAIQSIQIPTKISLDIGNWTVENSNNFAKVAYQIADEMMKARDE